MNDCGLSWPCCEPWRFTPPLRCYPPAALLCLEPHDPPPIPEPAPPKWSVPALAGDAGLYAPVASTVQPLDFDRRFPEVPVETRVVTIAKVIDGRGGLIDILM